VIERIILMGSGTGPITQADVEQVLPKSTAPPQTDNSAGLTLDEIERRHILRVLDASDGNKTAAAKTLDIDYKTLLAKLKKFAIDK
jgi:transcriptional regulator with PAS, ATPase and Fis domain